MNLLYICPKCSYKKWRNTTIKPICPKCLIPSPEMVLKEKYIILFDSGKPYEIKVYSDEQLIKELKDFWNINKDPDSGYYNAIVYDSSGEDISETQFISEIIGDIIEEGEGF